MKKLIVLFVLAACGDDAPVEPDAQVPDAMQNFQQPTIEITSHTDGQRILGARTITISGTITAGDGEIVDVQVERATGAETFDQTTWSAEVMLVDGTDTLQVNVRDEHLQFGDDEITLVYPFVDLTSFAPASLVLGQPDFTTTADPADGPVGTPYPFGRAAWAGEVLYVPSSDFHRVLGFHGFPSRNGEPGDFAIGQPDLTTVTNGLGPASLDFPETVDEDNGKLFVLDYGNSRILGYDTPPTTSGATASFAIGQLDTSTSTTGCNQSQSGFFDAFFVGGGKVFASDTGNNRVLIWNSVPTTSGVAPDVVLGQADFTHCMHNDDNADGVADAGPTARTLNDPTGIWSDGTRLFVVDASNHRVLVWNTIPTASFTPASFALGSPDLTTGAPGLAADRLNRPAEISGNGNQLAVTDYINHRILIWSPIPTTNTPAQLVLGQADFTHGTVNDDNQDGAQDATPSARTFNKPVGVEFVRDALIVSDLDNKRVLLFGPLPCAAGLYEPPGSEGTCIDDPCQPDPCTNTQVCRNDTGVAVCR